MKVPLRGRGGKQDKLKESKSAFSLHSAVIYLNFLLPARGSGVSRRSHTPLLCLRIMARGRGRRGRLKMDSLTNPPKNRRKMPLGSSLGGFCKINTQCHPRAFGREFSRNCSQIGVFGESNPAVLEGGKKRRRRPRD